MQNSENIKRVAASAENMECTVLYEEPLAGYTTFKIGGKASAVIAADTAKKLADLLKMCTDLNVPNFVIGNGSNLLISDDGYDGIVFKLDGDFKKLSMLDETTVYCASGVTLAKLCKFALDHNLSGLEFAWGIPGTAGGAAYMNAGAYGGEMSDVLASALYISPNGEQGKLSGSDLDLSYRHSAFSDNGCIISGIIVKLSPGSHDEIREKMDDYMSRRREKQPLEYPSAGSVFKRPQGYFAGGLIEQCNLKGKQIGGAQVSVKHAGFIINKGGATCSDVLSLIEHIQKTVFDSTGVSLECEIKRI